MIMTGDIISARQALEWGYIDEVAPHDRLEEVAMEWAMKLSRRSPAAMKLLKKLFWETQDMGPGEALPYIEDIYCRHAASEAGQEGIRAFLEKRKPSWLTEVEDL